VIIAPSHFQGTLKYSLPIIQGGPDSWLGPGRAVARVIQPGLARGPVGPRPALSSGRLRSSAGHGPIFSGPGQDGLETFWPGPGRAGP